MERVIRRIEPTRDRYTSAPIEQVKKKKVAGYARVSTDEEEQLNSYEAQVDYYSNLIKSHPDWEFAGLYSDEGITGTSTKARVGFRRMVEDAKAGKIDLILTKSISRFARNTVDSLTTIRELKEKGVEIYFEKENIHTLDSKGELLLTIMASLAQEESRSISENTLWGIRKSYADGKVSLAYSNFLGYDKGKDGKMVVNKEQAKVVRTIYKYFLEGMTFSGIANRLTADGIPSPSGKSTWHSSAIRSILQNEKYKGDAVLQKHYVADYLTKKLKKNEGELPQYYITGDHEAIISPEVFDMVQTELRERNGKIVSDTSFYSCKLVCGECGTNFGARVMHSTDKYRYTVYQCAHKYQGEKICRTPNLRQKEIEDIFLRAVNTLTENQDEVVANLEGLIETMENNTGLQEERERLQALLQRQDQALEDCVNENRLSRQNQDSYREQYDKLEKRYNKTKEKLEKVKLRIDYEAQRSLDLRFFVKNLKEQGSLVGTFNLKMYRYLVESITVYTKDDIRVMFRDGTEVRTTV